MSIWKQKKVCFLNGQFSNGQNGKLTIQNGNHFVSFLMVRMSGFQMAFEHQAFWQQYRFRPFQKWSFQIFYLNSRLLLIQILNLQKIKMVFEMSENLTSIENAS